jgi:hypothetical protein
VNALYLLLEAHLCPSLSLKEDKLLSRFWCEGPEGVVRKKVAEKQAYDQELRRLVYSK